MSSTAPATRALELRAALAEHRVEVEEVLRRYGATHPRLFGSVARGNASETSDIDLLVDLDEQQGRPLMRVAGISEELTTLLGVQVDVVTDGLLRDGVAATAFRDLVTL